MKPARQMMKTAKRTQPMNKKAKIQDSLMTCKTTMKKTKIEQTHEGKNRQPVDNRCMCIVSSKNIKY
jgi:hypothetical protein